MPMSNSEAGVPKLDDIDVKDVKHSPKIKREYKSPSYKTQRRLRCPVILDNAEKPKRSRLSSPLVVDNGDFDQNSQPIESNRRAKPECPSPRRRPVERNRNDRFVSDREATWGRISNDHRDAKPPEPEKPKEQPNFELSGNLAADTNTYKGVVIKYNEPEDARKPTSFWRLYPFKGQETLKVMHIHRQSGYLIGSSRQIADLPMLHPSISKQHAVLQFRFTKGKIRLYVIDLESTNGTFLNNKKIEPRRYYEVREKDVLKFGFSTREYVVMTDKTDTGSDENEPDK